MSVSRQAIGAVSSNGAVAERRTGSHVLSAIALAALFAVLWAAYFAVDAGVDYPEPWAQVAR